MSEAVKVSDAPPKNERLKIFISYSRIDAAAADTLVETLEARGFEVTIDRRALPFGEKWQAELAEFIRLSDTVIWLISEASVRSEWVNWELDEVARRAKRLVPVMIGDTPRDRLPRQLGEIHILPAEGQFHHVRDIDTLLEVLETDRAWLKQASRLQDRAAEWLANGRPSARLLSRAALADAERWNDRRPPKSPAPAQEVLDLLLVSRQSASRWQRRIVGGSLALTIGALALAGFAYQQQHRAQRSEAVTLKITDESQHTESGLLSEAARAISDQPGGGDTSLAILLALEGMPDKLSDDASRIERPWVAETQLQLSRAFGNHRSQRYWTQSGGVEKLTWNYDGKLLASSAGKTATIFDVLTGKVVASVTHENWVHEVKWNSSGRYLATGYTSSRIVDAGTASVTARVPHGDSVGINALEWSPDGQFWATGSVDKTVRITEAATGKELANIAHDGAVNVVAWSPNGKYIASGAARTARIIAPDTGRELSRISHESTVLCAAWSPNGHLLATGSSGWDDTKKSSIGEALIVEPGTGREIARIAHENGVNELVWSSDGRFLAIRSNNADQVRILEAATGRELAPIVHEHRVKAMAWSMDGQLLATGSLDNTARITQAATGKEVARIAHENTVSIITWTRDARMLATISKSTVRVVDAAIGKEIERIVHAQSVEDLAWSPDGRLLATASQDRTVRIVEVGTGREIARVAHDGPVWSLSWSPDGTLLATGNGDGSQGAVQIIQLANRWQLARTISRGMMMDLALSPNGLLVAIASMDGHLRLVDSATGQEVKSLKFESGVSSIAWRPDGRSLAVGLTGVSGMSGGARVLDLETDREVLRVAHERSVNDVDWSSDGKFLATASHDKTARVVEVSSGREVILLKHDASVNAVTWSPNGQYFATASDDRTVRIVDAHMGRETARIEHGGVVKAVAWNSDGRFLATGSVDRAARIIEVATSKEVVRSVHGNWVVALAWSPDGQRLATGADNDGRILEATTGRELVRLNKACNVSSISWRPDARHLTTACWDRTARIIDAATGKEVQRFEHNGSVRDILWIEKGPDNSPTVLTGSEDNSAVFWRAVTEPQSLVNAAKSHADRCLIQTVRAQYFLPPAPPTWCVARRLWPYHGNDWQAWLPKQKAWFASGREGVAPPLPKSE